MFSTSSNPDSIYSENCVGMEKSKGKWFDVACDERSFQGKKFLPLCQHPEVECSCSSFVGKSGHGNCQKELQTGPMCYVNEPSTCTDLVDGNQHDTTEKRYSWEACNNNQGQYFIPEESDGDCIKENGCTWGESNSICSRLNDGVN